MVTKRKIDFFGGLHGNYLELVVNYWIDQNRSYDISLPQFTDNGACHLKNRNTEYVPITTAKHYSFYGGTFNNDDLVIRIVPSQEDLLICVSNSFLRAGDQILDLENLEYDTYNKMSSLPKLQGFLRTLTENHGRRTEYPRHILRKYFYSMFEDYNNGLGMITQWAPANNVYNFDVRRFFNLSSFVEGLQEISKFVNLEFAPTLELVNLHKTFLGVNQGYISEVNCNKIIESIVSQEELSLKLNVVEEAWLNYKISKIFNLYEVPMLNDDIYPIDTKIISKVCYKGIPC